MVAVARHNNCTFEFVDHGFLDFGIFRLLVGKALAFLVETFDLLVDQLETIVDRKILRDVVDDQVETPLEDPRGREKSWPGLNGIVECLGFGAHEESGITADLA